MANYPLRIEDDLKEKLKVLAKEDKRSLNTLIVMILENHVSSIKTCDEIEFRHISENIKKDIF